MTNHAIFNRPLDAPLRQGYDQAVFGMGCYWAPERLFWQQSGIWLTQVGYAGGHVPNPSPEQVASGETGHAEVVRVIYDSSLISYGHLLQLFWENHDPTQGQGPHRSLIMAFGDSHRAIAEASKVDYGNRLALGGFGRIITQIIPAAPFWPAPDEDQQYLARHPDTDCPLGGTGIKASVPNPDTN